MARPIRAAFFVAIFGNQHTCGDSHYQIGDEVTIVSDLGKDIACSEVVLYNNSHW